MATGAAGLARRLGRETLQWIAGRHGYDLVSRSDRPLASPGVAEFIARRKADLVIDVGANEGQFGFELRAAGYRGRIVSLEPLAREAAMLQERVRGDAGWQVLRLAAGASEGTAKLSRARSSDYSSFRRPNRTGLEFDPAIAAVAEEDVPVTRLDSLAEVAGAARPFIKSDTQGYEQPVLEGAGALLDRAVGLQLELPLIHIYDDVWSFAEAIAHMERLGFVPAQFHPVSNSFAYPECTLEVDCVFRRNDRAETDR